MVDSINNNRSDNYLNKVRNYGSNFNNAKNEDSDKNTLSDDSRVDTAKDSVAALRESILGSRQAANASQRNNSVTHDFDDYSKGVSFLA